MFPRLVVHKGLVQHLNFDGFCLGLFLEKVEWLEKRLLGVDRRRCLLNQVLFSQEAGRQPEVGRERERERKRER